MNRKRKRAAGTALMIVGGLLIVITVAIFLYTVVKAGRTAELVFYGMAETPETIEAFGIKTMPSDGPGRV
jgi:uncharacterized integral membrane protein